MARQKQETRATYYSVNATALNRATQAKLATMRGKIVKMAEPWAEADPMIESATDRALVAIDELMAQYRDSTLYLNEPMDA